MLKIFNIYDSICGTCQFWSNPDKALAFQNVVPYIQYRDVQGRCARKFNVLMNPNVKACSNYKRWIELPDKK
ncbi:MAG: hypothetical protein GX937_02700 [Lentisphaerae bacterium]|jgi:hypothetical protein|nr:hypothetical protein [Lentisphaerota bacterium]